MELKAITADLLQLSRVEPEQSQPQILPQTALAGDTVAISVASMLKGLLDKTALQIAEQQSLVQSLPLPVQEAYKQILQTFLPDSTALSTGLTMLLTSRRNVTEELNRLADSLQLAALFPEQYSELQGIARSFNEQLSVLLTQRFATTSDTAILEQAILEQVRNLVEQSPKELQAAVLRLSTLKQVSDFVLDDTGDVPLQGTSSFNDPTDQAVLEQVRNLVQQFPKELQAAMVRLGTLRQESGASVPHRILQAAETLNMPALPKLWLLAEEISVLPQQGNLSPSTMPTDIVLDQAILEQVRNLVEQFPKELQDVAARLAALNKQSSALSVPHSILQVAEKLNMPELVKLWQLADTDFIHWQENPSSGDPSDQAVLEKVRNLVQQFPKELQAAIVRLGTLRQESGASVPHRILQAAETLNMPALPQLWLLAEEMSLVPRQGNLSPSTMSADIVLEQAILEQVRNLVEQFPKELQDAAARLATLNKQSSALSVPHSILQVAEKLNMPELAKLWQLADTDFTHWQENPSSGDQPDQAVLAKVRNLVQQFPKELQAAIVRLGTLRQESGVPHRILQAAETLNMPALPELWLLAEEMGVVTRQGNLSPSSMPANVVLATILEQVRNLVEHSPKELQDAAARLATLLNKQSSSFSVPHNVLQAAEELNMPALPPLWLLAETDFTPWQGSQPSLLEQGAATVRTLAELLNKTFLTTSEDRGQNLLFTIQLPFNLEATQPQPIHIHIFHEKAHANAEGMEIQPDTWVRITLQPEHTGPVETIFHLYGEDILDIKVIFADKQASQLFSEELPTIREACDAFPFLLREISVL